MPELTRLGIDDALAAVGVAPNSHAGQSARALDLLRKVSASVDHVERRTSDARKRGGLDREHLDANAADLDDAAAQAGVLRAAADAAGRMIAHMAAQVAPPAPAPAPKAPEPAKAK